MVVTTVAVAWVGVVAGVEAGAAAKRNDTCRVLEG